ncbi:hypothetical protein M8868_09225 [Pasteurella multocida]|uniref:Uncharacterized protein n=3 Tax=root TaxID=1 RepID=A0AAE9X084_9CAUD|nr:hypothetical protein [Pasteurella multocida]YP_654726.1 hypothetical protein [Pasteurella phage F108]WBY65437.1 hypothetical protein FP3_000006 [Pasteurella phage vB_PmuM_CFP3]ABD49444.1 unknown [Pasteurella phage F108]ARA69468.1 hypothetical protein BTV67_02565 [Pasteurella multocida subsp. multocida]ARA89190.1 hypothetical protein BTV66_06145 [Pasteurella multocida subsp. septica]EPE64927.1 hypothetical protein I141_10725 [Pasteurella multocida P1933]
MGNITISLEKWQEMARDRTRLDFIESGIIVGLSPAYFEMDVSDKVSFTMNKKTTDQKQMKITRENIDKLIEDLVYECFEDAEKR